MASVTSSVSVDGIDLSLMVGAVAQTSRPRAEALDAVESAATQTRISSDGLMQETLASMADAASTMSQAGNWRSTSANSSQPDVVSASTRAGATPGRLEVQIDQIASPQVTTASMFAPFSTTIGLGTLNIEMGQWNASMSTFTPNMNWPKASITAGPGDVSVERVRDRINAAGVGVIANVISDATGTFLLLRSAASGLGNGFRVSVETDPAASAAESSALQALGFNPASSTQGMTLTQAAQDAQLRIGDQTVTSPSNLIQGVVAGVDLTLKQSNPDTVSLQIEPDRSALQGAVQSFVLAYNGLHQQLKRANTSSPTTQDAAAVQQSIASIWSDQQNSSSLRNQLGAMGLNMSEQGRLNLDQAALSKALSASAESSAALGILGAVGQLTRQTGSNESVQPTGSPSATSASEQRITGSLPLRQRLLEQYADKSPITENAR